MESLQLKTAPNAPQLEQGIESTRSTIDRVNVRSSLLQLGGLALATTLSLSSGCFNPDEKGDEIGETVGSEGLETSSSTGSNEESGESAGESGSSSTETETTESTEESDSSEETETESDSSETEESETTTETEESSSGEMDEFCGVPPVAHWRFDEQGGIVAVDSAPGGNDGLQQNGPMTVAGYKANALDFDGVDDFVQVTDAPELNFGTGDFSMAYSIKTSSDQSGRIINKSYWSQFGGYSSGTVGNTGQFYLTLSDNSEGTTYYSGVAVNDGLWHEIGISVDRDSPTGGEMYVDGVLVKQFDPTEHQGNSSAAQPLYIGKFHGQNGGIAFFDGTLDEVRLYDQACK